MNCPLAVEEMAQFENDLLLLIKNLEFKKVHNDFQIRLGNDIKNQSFFDCIIICMSLSDTVATFFAN